MLNCEIFLSKFMQKGDDPGKFRQLDDIMFINGFPGYQHLLSVAEKSMQVVCEVKGGHVVYKIRKKFKHVYNLFSLFLLHCLLQKLDHLGFLGSMIQRYWHGYITRFVFILSTSYNFRKNFVMMRKINNSCHNQHVHIAASGIDKFYLTLKGWPDPSFILAIIQYVTTMKYLAANFSCCIALCQIAIT